MSERRFRFGVVATPQDGEQWSAFARRVADLGYTTLLMPDALQLLSPFPALALAAAAAPVRVGTFVVAAPLRPARTTAWEAHSLTALTGGRFELGIGTGLPIAAQQAREVGLPGGSPAQRLELIRQTVQELRRLDGDRHTPVMVAAGGSRAIALAAEVADTVALSLGPLGVADDAVRLVDQVRERAGARADDIELSLNVFVIGDVVPPQLARFVPVDGATLAAGKALTQLQGTPREMADELLRRRDRLGVSYVTVNSAFVEEFAPVLELLTGV
jgi:alkanesulfonate monooxygenase SsuD/methylene tetrahydromethanopterin reductase-like flavin-dependent oxidoreductase (luciferase family)